MSLLLGGGVFDGCKGLKFKEGLYLYDHGKKCYGYMGNKKSVTEIIIPEGVTYINEKAFTGLKTWNVSAFPILSHL